MKTNHTIESNLFLSTLYDYFEEEIEDTENLDKQIHAAIERADLSTSQDNPVQGALSKVKEFIRQSWPVPGLGDAEDRFVALAAADDSDTQRLASETGRFTFDRKVDEEHAGQYLYSVAVNDSSTDYDGRVPILKDPEGQTLELSPIRKGRAQTLTTVRLHGPVELHWKDTPSTPDHDA